MIPPVDIQAREADGETGYFLVHRVDTTKVPDAPNDGPYASESAAADAARALQDAWINTQVDEDGALTGETKHIRIISPGGPPAELA